MCAKATANVCTDPSSDTDGDGWGFENGVSCTVGTAGFETPGDCIDLDGDGWGWNGTSSCQTSTTSDSVASSTATAQSGACIDDDGDGWGWNGTASCQTTNAIEIVAPTTTAQSGACIDDDGDGWGWDGTGSCQITATSNTLANAVATAPATASSGPCIDDDGDGWGWNGIASCQTNASSDSTADSTTDTAVDTNVSVNTDTNSDTTATEPVELQPVVTSQSVEQQTTTSNTTTNVTPRSDSCVADSLSTLSRCIQQANNFDHLTITTNLSCSGNQCCPNGNPLINLNGVTNLEIDGSGTTFFRRSGHRNCRLIDIDNSSGITLRNWALDDDESVPGCDLGECPSLMFVSDSSNINLDRIEVLHGKAYAVYVRAVDGFTFNESVMHNAGIVGLYLGHSNQFSSNIRVTNSTFTDNQTNALALLGVAGSGLNIVENNTFLRNHRHGKFRTTARFASGFTPGGQLYVAQARNVAVRNNQIHDGYCDNCVTSPQARSGVSGIEVGIPNLQTVFNATIENNLITNLDGVGLATKTSVLLLSSAGR